RSGSPGRSRAAGWTRRSARCIERSSNPRPTNDHRQAAAVTVLERFLRYVRYDTQSDERSTTYPSTEKPLVLLRDLTAELREIGLRDAAIDEHGYVTATIPATTAKPGVPTIGFIAHVDTSP